ncbi:hypothetical protein EDC01DRAFT_58745 [Geopyxis carbonaria]|nr:hypothetical protein EDC01DRAFT_58745 [Geopyxis carbonaria]
MGQNYSSTAAAAADNGISTGIDVPELADISYEKSLGSARFLKTIRAKHADGLVVIKIFAKPPTIFPLDQYHRQVFHAQEALENIPNAFTYQRVIETDRAAYLVRQYLYSSLYDRISTRPFLEEIEKRWIAFQLLCGLRDCHAQGVHHGDIKAENVLVTSWNWIYLTDFAPFKPTYLPADNPADFSYFFDTSGRRICYVAPERFLETGQKPEDTKVTDEMDIFSLGCVIAELFLEGTPLFTLSQLFKYRSGEYDPASYLARIEDSDIRALVQHMISIDPSHRYSAEKYLNEWRRKAFPEYFYSFLHQYIGFITDPTSGRGPVSPEETQLYGRTDDRIERIYHDFDKISFFLGFEQNQDMEDRASSKDNIIPIHLDIPNYQRQSSTVRRRQVTSDDGTLIFLSLVASSLRNTDRAHSRVIACDIILAFAERITDEAKMDRCLPYLVSLLTDENANVQVAAMSSLVQLMELVQVASPVNSHIFPDYILPKIRHFATSRNALLRATYASCIASLANTAARFLDMTQALRADGALPTADPEAETSDDTETAFQALFDTSRNDLISYFQEHAKILLTDNDSAVRRAFLRSVSSLCVFFGRSKANDIILSHLNTYLNDKDWILRSAFFETITGIAAYLGSVALEEYIMPLMVQSLTDPEEFVVEKVLRSLASMAALGLFQRSKIWELVEVVGRFTMHPNIWIREGSVGFIAASTKWLAPADIQCIIYPLVNDFLKAKVIDLSALNLLENLKKPLTRTVFDMAVTWATQSSNSLFWRGAQGQRTFVFGSGSETAFRATARDVHIGGSKIAKNPEDEQWLAKLRNLGMASDDEWKIVALREYILRMARSKPRLLSDSVQSSLSTTIQLQDLKIAPQTIFFNGWESIFDANQASKGIAKPTTVADALIDASKTIDKPLKKSTSRLQLRRVASDIRRQQRSVEHNGSQPGTGSSTPIISHTQSETNLDTLSTSKAIQIPRLSVGGGSGSSNTSPSSVENNHVLRHKPSKNSLLNRGMGPSKATAETSTVSATAFGKVEPPFARDNTKVVESVIEAGTEKPVYKFRTAHSYLGNDPFILKHLDGVCMQNYPSDIMEFGPAIVPFFRRAPIKKSNGRAVGGAWKPEGNLVASFGEHTAAINRVVVAPDHNFFLTASDDGTVKVWDSTRLEKNVAFKSRQTYKHGNNLKVKALCFIENTRCFVSAASDGSVHVVKVDFQTSAAKYGKLKPMRDWQLPENEYGVWMDHFKAEASSILLIATTACNIYALDLRYMKVLYTLKNPVHHGTPTCFLLGTRHNWLLLGTSHGILDLWDLRFQLRIKGWGLSGSTPIHRLQAHPSKGKNRWIIVAGGTSHGELSVWDIEKSMCREVFRAGGGRDSGKGYEPWNVDDESSEKMLQRFASNFKHLEPGPDRGVRAFVAQVDMIEESADGKTTPGFIISAGADKKVRFWNCGKVENSVVLSGLDVDEPKPCFTATNPTPGLTLNIERPAGYLEAEGSVGGSSSSGISGIKGLVTVSTGSARKKSQAGRTPRSTVISHQQQQLLKSHLDSILDVAFLEVPYGMVISVDRSGMIFVYQ